MANGMIPGDWPWYLDTYKTTLDGARDRSAQFHSPIQVYDKRYMEHEIYRVLRKQVGAKVELSLQDHPKLRVLAGSAEDAEVELIDLICEKFGDGEPVLDYFDTVDGALSDDLWVFSCNEKGNTLNLADLYAEGLCKHCGIRRGRRKHDCVRIIKERLKGDVCFTTSGPVVGLIF